MVAAAGNVTHVIFDFDGLLVDTEHLYTTANKMMLGKFGIEFTMEIKRKMMGKKHMEAITWLVNEVGIDDRITPEAYASEYDAWLDVAYLTAPALPGARKLVEHLAAKNIPMAICTGSCSRTFALKNSGHLDWTSSIPLKVCTGDDPNVVNGKPHPEPFLYTMKLFNEPDLKPENCLVFEDAPNGVEAALAAGMQCVMVPELNVFSPDDCFKARLNACLGTLDEFIPERFGLPPYAL